MSEAAEAEALDGLARLVRWPGQGVRGVAWQTVEHEMGVALPASFKDFVARFPAGLFQILLQVEQPRSAAELHDYAERVEDKLSWFRELASMTPEFQHDIFPQLPGLFPWGSIGTDILLLWRMSGVHDDSPGIVVVDTVDFSAHEFSGTIVDFIVDVIGGRVHGLHYLAESHFPPRFDPLWLDGESSHYYRYDYLKQDPDHRMIVGPDVVDVVDELATLVKPVVLPETVDWSVGERDLQHPLPRDYKRFIETVGPGRYGDVFVASPHSPTSEYPGPRAGNAVPVRYSGDLTYWAETQSRWGSPDPVTNPIVWGEVHGWFCGWMPGDYPPDQRPVLVFRPGHRGQVYRQSMTGFLASHLQDLGAMKDLLWRIGEPE